jgi:hypothetical protein
MDVASKLCDRESTCLSYKLTNYLSHEAHKNMRYRCYCRINVSLGNAADVQLSDNVALSSSFSLPITTLGTLFLESKGILLVYQRVG